MNDHIRAVMAAGDQRRREAVRGPAMRALVAVGVTLTPETDAQAQQALRDLRIFVGAYSPVGIRWATQDPEPFEGSVRWAQSAHAGAAGGRTWVYRADAVGRIVPGHVCSPRPGFVGLFEIVSYTEDCTQLRGVILARERS